MTPQDLKIWGMFNLGYNDSSIAAEVGVHYSYINGFKRKYLVLAVDKYKN